MTSRHFLSILFSFSLLFFYACGEPSSSEQDSADDGTEETSMESQEIVKSEFSTSPDYPGAKLELAGYTNGKFTFNVSNYELKAQTSDAPQKMCANSDQGQHIHLIIDDEPYAAKYESTFDHEVADGEHFLLAFLSRSYHESLKTDDAHVVLKGTFSGNGITSQQPVTEPMLFYSRPKGTYVGKANTDKVMLDFYLVNTTLAPNGNKVKVEVNGEEKFLLDEWKPVFIEGLPMGDNKIRLTLLNNEGIAINTPLNPVERVFTLKEDPIEQAQ